MGRQKQANPRRSGALLIENKDSTAPKLDTKEAARKWKTVKGKVGDKEKPFYFEVDRTGWTSNEHLDISEIFLTDLNLGEGFAGDSLDEEGFLNSKYSLRFHVRNVNDSVARIKLGHWPVLSSRDVSLEFVMKCSLNDAETSSVILSGKFDGPHEGISGLVHLANQKFLTLRPVMSRKVPEGALSQRLRVEILRGAFDACESILENSRQFWKRSMLNLMGWLRPEVLTSETRYGIIKPVNMEVDRFPQMGDETSKSSKHTKFDVAGFYEEIKQSKKSLMLKDEFPDLLPVLRPYQRRAVYWMVQREKCDSEMLVDWKNGQYLSPLSVPVEFLDTRSKMFFNPFSGNISMQQESASPYVYGGILADEMGLGKTVELLACMFAHQKPSSDSGMNIDNLETYSVEEQVHLRRLKRERVECICGAVSESRKYNGLWVQCDICDAWQHADCVGYSPGGKVRKAIAVSKQQEIPLKRKKGTPNIILREGEHVCQSCSELIQATEAPITTGATLIVCPAPILSQWHSEIIRHTRPGSLKIYVYEGVRSCSLSNASAVNVQELVDADIVLTTYDVLKEDMSHDSDRHEGDRHFLRFQKRYPVVPTFLTRISWWRICLDEAQMVESNTTAATEMALRLHAKYRWCITGTPIQRKLDDLYGLLKFIKASPFDVLRWWVEVIRDPYERADAVAMEFTHKFFKQIMWRSSKAYVADELHLPPQKECVSWLTFSPIEEHFYKRQHETCVSYACEVIESLKADIMKRKISGCSGPDASFDPFITHVDAEKLLNYLLKLRQACCHPQVGSSGLRTLQQAPMTMDEILKVLISKTKVEGEEALRKVVSSVNGLAGIAMIEQNVHQAVHLYKEALSITEDNFDDFRLDPLLNIHIQHNLSEILSAWINSSRVPECSENWEKASKTDVTEYCEGNAVKRQKLNPKEYTDFDETNRHEQSSHELGNTISSDKKLIDKHHMPPDDLSAESLKIRCEKLKQKYLSVFTSKLSGAQLEFRKMYLLSKGLDNVYLSYSENAPEVEYIVAMASSLVLTIVSIDQVCDSYIDMKNQQRAWWLDALYRIEESRDSSELIRKIEESISGTSKNSRTSQMASRLHSITGLKYHIQTGLDMLEASRRKLLDRLLEVDQTMENPKEEDIERVRRCQNCQVDGDGPLCVHCELDELFQEYEARLFRVTKTQNDGEMVISAEEAIELRKKNSARNRFYRKLSQSSRTQTADSIDNDEREIGENLLVSKAPSDLEVALGVIKTYCKADLGRDDLSAATKQLQILEAMRKEYRCARLLSISQAQLMHAHDEIKMATTRLRLREDENDKSIDALSLHELPAASVENSSEKFISLDLLSKTKGKLRYLKGLVLSKNKPLVNASTITHEESTCLPKVNEEACPVCQEKLSTQKMVFQCGHVTCCKCLFAMTERRLVHENKSQNKWVMCPVCRQHTDVGNIAYADDSQVDSCKSALIHTIQGDDMLEATINVEGSYGTKLEAVTRRILWIKSADPKAKVLVFSSWKDVLDVLEHAFTANAISYIRMKGGRQSHVAISEFKEDKKKAKGSGKTSNRKQEAEHVQVLLLLIQHGANGLNLLEAQHVILVEPLLNPAVEAQAISRVHRIGQEKQTLVHRFLVKGTVEESIFKLSKSRNSGSLISGNTKNQDQPVLTLKDIESLFSTASSTVPETKEKRNDTESLRHLPPSVAAAIAAERRFKENAAV